MNSLILITCFNKAKSAVAVL